MSSKNYHILINVDKKKKESIQIKLFRGSTEFCRAYIEAGHDVMVHVIL